MKSDNQLVDEILQKHGLAVQYLDPKSLVPSEHDTWEKAAQTLEIDVTFPVHTLPVGAEERNGEIEVQDGHHRTTSAILRGDKLIAVFVLPKSWDYQRQSALWDDYNYRWERFS